jgi:hypothetical protein
VWIGLRISGAVSARQLVRQHGEFSSSRNSRGRDVPASRYFGADVYVRLTSGSIGGDFFPSRVGVGGRAGWSAGGLDAATGGAVALHRIRKQVRLHPIVLTLQRDRIKSEIFRPNRARGIRFLLVVFGPHRMLPLREKAQREGPSLKLDRS